MMDGLAAQKYSTAGEKVKVVHTLVMCDRRRVVRSIARDVGISFGGSTIDPNRHLRYVKDFGKMGAVNVDRWSEKDSARYF